MTLGTGILTEDIYRRATSSVVLTELLERFKADAWSVQLTPQTYSEHVVAGLLKRFLRNLHTPLISRECKHRLIYASGINQVLVCMYNKRMITLTQNSFISYYHCIIATGI